MAETGCIHNRQPMHPIIIITTIIIVMQLGHLLTRYELHIQKSLQWSPLFPSAFWSVVIHYPPYVY
jgi:hypothetical protein